MTNISYPDKKVPLETQAGLTAEQLQALIAKLDLNSVADGGTFMFEGALLFKNPE